MAILENLSISYMIVYGLLVMFSKFLNEAGKMYFSSLIIVLNTLAVVSTLIIIISVIDGKRKEAAAKTASNLNSVKSLSNEIQSTFDSSYFITFTRKEKENEQ